MTAIDLDSPDLTWISHAIAGSDQPASLSMLHTDEARGTRSVYVRFPDGWSRDVVGNQPAGEEMVILSGALSISGHTASVGDYLVVEPRATRAATSVTDSTSALVFFSGPGGGWAEGEAADAGSISLVSLAPGEVRGPQSGLVGTASYEDVAGQVFDHDVEILWPVERTYVHVGAGTAAPDISGEAVVRHLG